MSFLLSEIASRLGGEIVGDGDIRIDQVATLSSAGPNHVAFLASGKYRRQLDETRAGAVILGRRDRESTQKPRIVSDNPYVYFARVSQLLNPPPAARPGVHPSAVIGEGAKIHPTASIGPFCTIGAHAVIGAGCAIQSSCNIGERVVLGSRARIYPGVTIYADCIVGDDCIFHSGVVIGSDGFGIAMDQGQWVKIPQIGRVVIGNDVEIGANTTVDRGALDDTVIMDGAKIDNQVQIAHNVVIGKHTAIAGCTGIAGSAKIGNYCKIGGSGMILGHLSIADHVDISAGTMITKSIEESGAYTSIYPFAPHREWLKNSVHLRHLNGLAGRVGQLEKHLEDLEREKS